MEAFVRRAFYIDPPAKTATKEEWQEWLKKDRTAGATAKRAHTLALKALEDAQDHESLECVLNQTSMRKVNGIWKQAANTGFTAGEEGSFLEPTVEANQERDYIRARMTGTERGHSHNKSGAEKRRERKERRKAKKNSERE
jgi:hypothetical protein